MSEQVKPYDPQGSKKEQIASMFDNISGRYDLLNHLLSLNIDKYWRGRAVKLLAGYRPKTILDVATGTGDFAISLMKLEPEKITGIDISEGMLEVGQKKVVEKQLDNHIELMVGDAEQMPFDNHSFEAVTVAFGVRNFESLNRGISEIYRVLKPGYPAVILEFSKPDKFPVKQLYNFYFKYILPTIGRLLSSDQRAYSYLPESVEAFPEGKDFIALLETCGFRHIKQMRLTFGIATIYLAEK
ncbi:MAG: bifunctional demethylmenaquinone methyltransferase/2-methoxy-6-polyprenyl-1,4-benzoquinol methylase UbiE [Salibacteraceae bacterium]